MFILMEMPTDLKYEKIFSHFLKGRQCDTSFNKKLSKYAMKFWGNVRRQMCEQFYTLLSFLVVYLKILAQKPRQMLFRENRLETFFSDERVVCG